MKTVTVPLRLWEDVAEIICDMSNAYEHRFDERLQRTATMLRQLDDETLENSNDD